MARVRRARQERPARGVPSGAGGDADPAARTSRLRCQPLFAANAVDEALLWCDRRNPREAVLDPRLRAVLEYGGDHLERPYALALLVGADGLSASRLAHLAIAQLGMRLMSYVEQQRMELARQLLDLTDLPVAQIAARVGFADPLYFSQRFRAATSMFPSGFRTWSRTAPAVRPRTDRRQGGSPVSATSGQTGH
ncbi:helix-turn-helix domain-containing protein [Streptomyces sp. NPDC059460]|uniref:helix-turn-helix domain-containing protein n=1 Tax=Streptomyces sp. NPDC059460 TaxID=3346840 RepID=UPI00367F8991